MIFVSHLGQEFLEKKFYLECLTSCEEKLKKLKCQFCLLEEEKSPKSCESMCMAGPLQTQTRRPHETGGERSVWEDTAFLPGGFAVPLRKAQPGASSMVLAREGAQQPCIPGQKASRGDTPAVAWDTPLPRAGFPGSREQERPGRLVELCKLCDGSIPWLRSPRAAPTQTHRLLLGEVSSSCHKVSIEKTLISRAGKT